MTGETGRVSIPSNTVTVGEDSAYNIQEFLGSCVDIVRTGDTMCCNDSNTCNTPEPPTNHDLTGYDPNKVYSTAEVVVLLTANSENPNVLDLGLGTSGQTADSLCTQAATIRNRSGADAYIVQQNTAQVGIRIVKERIVCVMH